MNPPLRPYPETRDSGAAWLGRVPTHWAVRRLKSAFENVVALAPASQVRGPQIALEDVESWTGAVCVEDSSRRLSGQLKQFRRDDILFGKLRPYLAKVTTASEVGACVGEFLVLRRRIAGGATPYFESLLRSSDFIAVVNGTVAGAKMPRAEWPSVDAFPIPVPPLAEQRSIARFLDHSCRRIGRYLAAKERLIGLLEEQKQALIRRAVTRGLDPTVPHKPSGIEWLGDIPAHWTAVTLRMVTDSIQTGPFGSQLHQEEYVTGGIPVVNPAHLLLGRIEPNPKVSVTSEKAAQLAEHRLRTGDVVMARRGEMGRCAMVTEEHAGWICGTGSIRIRPKGAALVPRYLVLLLSSVHGRRVLTEMSIGTTMNNLSAGAVSAARFALPPAAEQQAIVAHLDRATAALDAAIARTRRQRELVAEYRTRLVADVATGKLDVREAARRLPADPDDGDGARA